MAVVTLITSHFVKVPKDYISQIWADAYGVDTATLPMGTSDTRNKHITSSNNTSLPSPRQSQKQGHALH